MCAQVGVVQSMCAPACHPQQHVLDSTERVDFQNFQGGAADCVVLLSNMMRSSRPTLQCLEVNAWVSLPGSDTVTQIVQPL